MYICSKLLKLMRKHGFCAAEMTFWYVLGALADIARMAVWAELFISAIQRELCWLSVLGIPALTWLYRMVQQSVASRDRANGRRFKQSLRRNLYEKIFQLGPQYMDKKRCGELVDTFHQQIEWLKFYFVNYVPLSISVLILGFGFGIYGWMVSPAMGIAIFVSVMAAVVTPPAFHEIVQRHSAEEWTENARFYSDCMDGLRGLNMLKAFNINENQRKRMDAQGERLRQATMKNLVITTLNSQAIEFFVSAMVYIPLIVGAFVLAQGTMQWETLLLLFLTLHALSAHARNIRGMWLRASKGIAGIESIFEILDAKCVYALSSANAVNEAQLAGDICFNHVTFSYDGAKKVIENLDLTIPQGTQTALVGTSGSGKSTLARLLFGFYKPQEGSVSIGGTPINAQTVAAAQNGITAIWQDCHIFQASCFDNIQLASPEASAEDVYLAAKKANIHDLILSLPNGYDTMIGNGGAELSGGERQRIILARAFLRDAPILILDEATSSLDRKNEAEIQECIQKLSRDKTVLVIAHRMDTIRHADQICVMENGRIIERGTHEVLMVNGRRYAELMGAAGGEERAE